MRKPKAVGATGLTPIPDTKSLPRTHRCSTYVEEPLNNFFEEYQGRMGARSVSESIRRLALIGAISEGYVP